ncbi:MAG: DUF5640 domain-containing protein [Treponema sp.]|nr:DUF5640 domain-containing protein [Treponema sp.]MCL2245339.1 DUF5640 domain-containing protein [Treponema sp.]
MRKTFKTLLIITIFVVMTFSMGSCASFMDEVVLGTFREFGSEMSQTFTQTVSLIGIWRLGEFSWLFDTNGTGTMRYTNGSLRFTWTTDGDQLSITTEGASTPMVYTFSIRDNELTLRSNDSSITYTRS